MQETGHLLSSFMATMSRDAGSGAKTFEQVLGELAHDILERLPQNFDLEAVSQRYPQVGVGSVDPCCGSVGMEKRGDYESPCCRTWPCEWEPYPPMYEA